MKHSNSGFKSKVASAVKYFFTGDDDIYNKTPSSARELSLDEFNMVSGGADAAVEEYQRLRELFYNSEI